MRTLRLSIVALLLACGSTMVVQSAQPPTPEHAARVAAARQKLRSPDPATIAWGAFDAGTYRLRELVPELVALLEGSPAAGRPEEWALTLVVLDAVVQLEAAVPAETLKTYAARNPVQTSLALANATGGRHAVVLDLLSSANGDNWFALANLLVEPCAPGFAASLLSPMRFRLTITVAEPGLGLGAQRGSGIGPAGVADGIGQIPAGFPPLAWYRFEGLDGPWQRRGNIVLSSGPRSVYYSRVVHATSFWASSTLSGGPSDVDRMLYLGSMLDRGGSLLPVGTRLPVERFEHIEWRGEADFVRKSSELHDRVLSDYRFIVDNLVKRKCLSGEEASRLAKPSVDVQIEDRREKPSTPLPRLPLER
jgi:hypothetical protein